MPTSTLISLEPWSIILIFISDSARAVNILEATPLVYAIPVPTVAINAILGYTTTESGLHALLISSTIISVLFFKLESEINRMKNMLDSVNVSDKIDYEEEKYILAKKN